MAPVRLLLKRTKSSYRSCLPYLLPRSCASLAAQAVETVDILGGDLGESNKGFLSKEADLLLQVCSSFFRLFSLKYFNFFASSTPYKIIMRKGIESEGVESLGRARIQCLAKAYRLSQTNPEKLTPPLFFPLPCLWLHLLLSQSTTIFENPRALRWESFYPCWHPPSRCLLKIMVLKYRQARVNQPLCRSTFLVISIGSQAVPRISGKIFRKIRGLAKYYTGTK